MYKSHSNRGKHLEKLIEFYGHRYQNKQIAYLIKYPPVIKHLRTLKNGQFVATYAAKGQPDYLMISEGNSFLFDAKEFKGNRFPFSNLHAHQFKALNEFEKCGGYSALLLHAIDINQLFVAPFISFKSLYMDWMESRISHKPTKRGSASISLEYMSNEFIQWDDDGFLTGFRMMVAERDLPW
tara:strand:- start:9 stop:554 length:546 start_codon:yes stop_codon:yes gene_type:complete